MSSSEMRILLVDDFEMVRVMIRNALTDLGYSNIDEADNGRVAMDMLKQSYGAQAPYQFVFCDWNMPEMSGIEVLEACRASEQFKDIPFIMVTTEADQESVVRALKAGATDYLIKPISPNALERKINRILSTLKGK